MYSYLLARGGASITAAARSNYTTLSTSGVHISSAIYGEIANWKPDRTIRESQPAEARDRYYDFVVCSFKNVPDYKSASAIIRPFLKRRESKEHKLPTIVLLQNGVGIEEEVQRNLVEGQEPVAAGVLSAVAWIGANLVQGGTKVVHGALERLEVGAYPSHSAALGEDGMRQVSQSEQQALDAFISIYTGGGGGGQAVSDIEAIRWKKVLWNASWGALASLSRTPISHLLTPSTLHYSVGVVRRIMLEIVYVARSCGLSESRFPISSVDQALNISLSTAQVDGVRDESKGATLAADFKPSILLDLENRRPMELEVIVGNVVSKARENNVETPRLDLVLAALKPSQVAAVQSAIDKDGGESLGIGVMRYEQLSATSRGNWPEGAPVSKSPHTYM